MKKRIAILAILLVATAACISGCAHYQYSVYGNSGKSFQSPTLCGALVACLASSESSCYYDATVMTGLDGKTLEENTCKKTSKR